MISQKSVLETQPQILLVSTDPANLQGVANDLMQRNHNVTTAGNSLEALGILGQRGPIHLIILDLMMSQMAALGTCQKIREHFSREELPIILVTSKNQIDDAIAGLRAGANDFMTKPLDRDEFFARIDGLLELRKNTCPKEKLLPQCPFNYAERIGQVEQILKKLLSTLHQENQVLLPPLWRPAPQETSPPSSFSSTELRITLVELLSLSIQYWVKANKKPKEVLAEESGLWQVHLKKRGVFRARTLERYSSIKTLPKRPNLYKVIQTAEYVLYTCPEIPQMKNKLESLLAQLKTSLH